MIFALHAVAPFILGYLSKSRFDRSFTTLSILFAFAFFCWPAVAAYTAGRVDYLGQSKMFTGADFADALIGMLAFGCGFAALSAQSYIRERFSRTYQASHAALRVAAGPRQIRMRSKIRRLPAASQEASSGLSVAIEVFFAIAIVAMVYYLYKIDFYKTNIDLRQHVVKANYAVSTSMMALYFIGSFYLIRSLNMKSIPRSGFWFICTLTLILVFGGRVQTLLVLALPAVRFFKRLNFALVVMCTVILALFPLIIGGKFIIAAIAHNDNVVQTMFDLYSNPVSSESVTNNFSHPFVSYFYAPQLVDELGYRWGWDIPQGMLFYLQLFGLDFGKSLTYYNTQMLLGIDESIIPPGYLAFGFVQANLLGVFAMGAFFRFTGSVARFVKERSLTSTSSSDFFFAFLAANTFYIGEVRGLILTYFAPLMLIYMVGAMQRRRALRVIHARVPRIDFGGVRALK